MPTNSSFLSTYNKNYLPTTIASLSTIFDNYSTMTFEQILTTLNIDTSNTKDQNNIEVDLTKYEKLTDTCAIFLYKYANSIL